jgi:hypothetical protein
MNNGMDAGLAGPLGPDDVAARLTPSTLTVRATLPKPVAAPEPPAPEPVDGRPLETLEREVREAADTLAALRDRRATLAAHVAELDGRIAEQAATLTPGATLDARRDRSALTFEQAELDDLITRASGQAERAAHALARRQQADRAAQCRAKLAELQEAASRSDAAIAAAIDALLDREDERAELVREGERIQAELDALPPDLAGQSGRPVMRSGGTSRAMPGYLPPGLRFDRSAIRELSVPYPRPRRLGLLGL